jgi:hypothetical protein
LSVTTSEKVSGVAPGTCGAANVGCATLALESVIVGEPAVCVHA